MPTPLPSFLPCWPGVRSALIELLQTSDWFDDMTVVGDNEDIEVEAPYIGVEQESDEAYLYESGGGWAAPGPIVIAAKIRLVLPLRGPQADRLTELPSYDFSSHSIYEQNFMALLMGRQENGTYNAYDPSTWHDLSTRLNAISTDIHFYPMRDWKPPVYIKLEEKDSGSLEIYIIEEMKVLNVEEYEA